MALAPDIDEAVRNQAFIQLCPRTGMRLFGSQARMGVLCRPRNIPVAGHDDASVSTQLAPEVHHLRLKSALEVVSVPCDASCLVEVGLCGPVDRINVDEGKARPAHSEDSPLPVPRNYIRTPVITDERRNAIHATTPKGNVARIACKRVMTLIAGQSALQGTNRIIILWPDA